MPVFQKLFSARALDGEEGQDLVEYALLLGFIALASVGVLVRLSNNIGVFWTAIANRLASTS